MAKRPKGMDRELTAPTARGKSAIAPLPVENADMETVTLSNNPQFLALIERSRARHKAEGGISSDEMRRRLGLRPKED